MLWDELNSLETLILVYLNGLLQYSWSKFLFKKKNCDIGCQDLMENSAMTAEPSLSKRMAAVEPPWD